MQILIKGTGMELTMAIRDYVDKKIGGLSKFLVKIDNGAIEARVEVGQTTKHHQSGNIFRAEVNLKLPKTLLRAESETSDLYASIDLAHDEIKRQILDLKDKKVTEKVRQSRSARSTKEVE